ncbi:hypothetical protein RRG08_067049 [Elysia crispata]|uniref:Uncharacterized protein n=1 Tax=Elysia crispata TaxID=231223 RepID=A0AAE1B9F7_9GAST|nr:hypothetical protein RRG08_067049 [Elysia crispata]
MKVEEKTKRFAGDFRQIGADMIVSVCKTFFLHTLDIGEQMVTTALVKRGVDPIVQADRRGSNHMHQGDEKKHILDHIESFPVVDSHYCRKTTKRHYLGGYLRISMIRRLYEEAM